MSLNISYIDNQNQHVRDEISKKLQEQGIDKSDERAGNKNSLFGKIDGQLAYINIGSSGDHNPNDKFHAQVIDKNSGKWRDLTSNEYEAFTEKLSERGALKDRAKLLENSGSQQDAKLILEYGAYTNNLSKISQLAAKNKNILGENFSKTKNEITDVSEITDLQTHFNEINGLKEQLKKSKISWEDNGASIPPIDQNVSAENSVPPKGSVINITELSTNNEKLIGALEQELKIPRKKHSLEQIIDLRNYPLETDSAKKLIPSKTNPTVGDIWDQLERGIKQEIKSSKLNQSQQQDIKTTLDIHVLSLGYGLLKHDLQKYNTVLRKLKEFRQ
jgi:hypothetical protein